MAESQVSLEETPVRLSVASFYSVPFPKPSYYQQHHPRQNYLEILPPFSQEQLGFLQKIQTVIITKKGTKKYDKARILPGQHYDTATDYQENIQSKHRILKESSSLSYVQSTSHMFSSIPIHKLTKLITLNPYFGSSFRVLSNPTMIAECTDCVF